MKSIQADLVVIGSGPAGQKGAIQAAKLGKKVILVDKTCDIGGACLHSGTIPSKTFRESVLDLTGFLERSYYGRSNTKDNISINDLNFRLHKVLSDEQALINRQFAKNGIELISGLARFNTDHLIEVVDDDYQPTCLIETDRTLICTGSRPRNPIDIPFDKDTILDSDQLLKIDHLPESMMVLGSGIIGSEYATMFAALGTKVILVDKQDRPLDLLDREISQRFVEYIQQMGVEFKLGHPIVSITKTPDNQAEVLLESGERVQAQCLFAALGRVANADSLQLDNVGVELTDRGYISVNALFQSTNPNIYAAGDVIGSPALAATSMEQGRLAVRNAFALKTHQFPEFFPYGIYTIPEVSSIGPTEEQLKEKGIHYQVGKAYFYEIGRGPITADTSGMFKLIFHAETLEVLAVHIIGSGATELIHIGQLAIDFRARINYFVDQIFNYPTFAEGYRIAALNGLNKLNGSVKL